MIRYQWFAVSVSFLMAVLRRYKMVHKMWRQKRSDFSLPLFCKFFLEVYRVLQSIIFCQLLPVADCSFFLAYMDNGSSKKFWKLKLIIYFSFTWSGTSSVTKYEHSANPEKNMTFLPLVEILITACNKMQRKRKRFGRVCKVPIGSWSLKAELQRKIISCFCLLCFPWQSLGDWFLFTFLKSRLEPGFRTYVLKYIKVALQFVLFPN